MTGTHTATIGRARGESRMLPLALLLLAALICSLGVAQPAAAATLKQQLTLAVNTTQFLPGESVVAYGDLKMSDGTPLASRPVSVQKQTSNGWVTIARTTTLTNGHYRLYVREVGSFVLRTQVNSHNGAPAAGSTPVELQRISGTQTLENREAQLSRWLNAPTSGIKTGTNFGTALRWRTYQNGILVEGAGRVYVVWGALRKGFASSATSDENAPMGKLGRPISDADCYLTTSKCVQPFSRGAVYYESTSITAKKTHVAYGIGVGAELIAAAMSQVGYREPGWRINKYTDWSGLRVAWCGVFQSYNSAATKNGQAVPQVKTFGGLLTEVRKRGITSTPRVGALVFMTFAGGREPTHVGIVTKVHANGSVDTIEGNTVMGSDPARVVAKKTRTPSQIRFYYIPGT